MEKYLDFNNNIDETKLEIVGKTIANGGLVIFPTETVYGIGTNGLDAKAIKKIKEVLIATDLFGNDILHPASRKVFIVNLTVSLERDFWVFLFVFN